MTIMSDDRVLSRRNVIAAATGIAGLGGVGYFGARQMARNGRVNVRIVSGEDVDGSTIVGSETLFTEQLNPDGSTPDRRFHPDYRQSFSEKTPITVSQTDHKQLQQNFDRVVYALSHSCPNADCSSPQVSRHDFNSVSVGDDVQLLYHSGDSATIIP